jgi:hypothetical protein
MSGLRLLARLVWVASLSALFAASSTVSAIDPCPDGASRKIPYSTIVYGARLPHLIAGFYPHAAWEPAVPRYVGCSHNPFQANYAGLAVGQTQVFNKPVGYFEKCDALLIRVMNGAFQWGPLGLAVGGSGAVAQSVVAGNVLLMEVTMASAFGNPKVVASWAGDPACPMW